jgi:hypothetical protein
MVKTLKTLSLAAVGLTLTIGLTPIAASASPSAAALRSIRASAASVASRRRVDRAQLRGPARAIAVTWAKIEPRFASDPDALVETDKLNRAIASFENDWARNVGMAPSDARTVEDAANQLLGVT